MSTALESIEFTQAQLDMIHEKTPPIMRKKVRKGGGNYDYVPVGYVVDRLNRIFRNRWTFEVLREQIGDGQCWVLGRLQVMQGDGVVIRKENFGGADIKKYGEQNKNAGKAMSIANDLKSAAADSLKKCASMLGVCLDVYAPVLDEFYEQPDVEEKMGEEELAQVKEWAASLRAAKDKAALTSVSKDIGKLKITAAQRRELEEAFMERLSQLENAK
jgi:hypothetical protein